MINVAKPFNVFFSNKMFFHTAVHQSSFILIVNQDVTHHFGHISLFITYLYLKEIYYIKLSTLFNQSRYCQQTFTCKKTYHRTII